MTRKQLKSKVVNYMNQGLLSGEALELIKAETIVDDPNTEWTTERELAEDTIFTLTMAMGM